MWAGHHNCLANLSSFKWPEETVSYREDLPPPPIVEFTFVFFSFFNSPQHIKIRQSADGKPSELLEM